MIVSISKLKYSKRINIPKSKSFLQRAIAIAALSKQKVEIIGVTKSKDYFAAKNAIIAMGGKILEKDDSVLISPGGSQVEINMNCNEAGLSSRMFSAVAATQTENLTITGKGSLLNRPMNMVVHGLEQLGLSVSSKNNKLPISTAGIIKSNDISIDGSESSQFLSGLLLALPVLNGDSTITVSNLKSTPYIDMTIAIAKDFGVNISHESYEKFHIKGGQSYNLSNYKVEGDWSAAVFHIVGAAISGEIEIYGLNKKSSQADIAILEVLNLVGVWHDWKDYALMVKKSQLNPFIFDATNCPDLFPALAVLASFCKGVSVIQGVHRLYGKESDRASAIQSELQKVGVTVQLLDDEMRITGTSVFKNAKFESHNDHRMAMSLSLFSIAADISINGCESIDKSYPNFFNDIKPLVDSIKFTD